MVKSTQEKGTHPSARKVNGGEDRFKDQRGLGISNIAFKVSKQDSRDIFIIENSFQDKGGPARHLHFDQDEWFFAVEGEFRFEVGNEKFRLLPGDALFAPRKVPHVWAFTGEGHGRILIAFAPAGKMEAFFREVTKNDAMPPQDPQLWLDYGMELLGPPMTVDP